LASILPYPLRNNQWICREKICDIKVVWSERGGFAAPPFHARDSQGKVCDECKKHGYPSPVYEVSAGDPGDILVRIDAAPDPLLDSSCKTSASSHEPVNSSVGVIEYHFLK